ncbi:MAG: GNAT family N-acetyltransferase [bacterium]
MNALKQSKSGVLDTLDKKGEPIIFDNAPVILEWHKVDNYETFSRLAKQTLPVTAEAFANEVRDFVLDDKFHVRPEYAKLIEKLPKEVNAGMNAHIAATCCDDRSKRVEATLQAWKQEYECLWTKFSACNPVFVIAKNKDTQKVWGWASFICAHPELSQGHVYLDILAVAPETQKRGLARALVFSILKIMPETTHIILDTRIWNISAQKVYENLGFNKIDSFSKNPTYVGFRYVAKK